MIIPNIWKNKNVPNHQPVMILQRIILPYLARILLKARKGSKKQREAGKIWETRTRHRKSLEGKPTTKQAEKHVASRVAMPGTSNCKHYCNLYIWL